MPLFEFRCEECRGKFEWLQRSTDDWDVHCPTCWSERVVKVASVPANPQFRGNGFYHTDYKRRERVTDH